MLEEGDRDGDGFIQQHELADMLTGWARAAVRVWPVVCGCPMQSRRAAWQLWRRRSPQVVPCHRVLPCAAASALPVSAWRKLVFSRARVGEGPGLLAHRHGLPAPSMQQASRVNQGTKRTWRGYQCVRAGPAADGARHQGRWGGRGRCGKGHPVDDAHEKAAPHARRPDLPHPVGCRAQAVGGLRGLLAVARRRRGVAGGSSGSSLASTT